MAPTFDQRVRRVDAQLARQIGEEVERLRADAGLARHSLAAAAGVDPAYLGRIERGAARPSQQTLVRLALALGADLTTRLYPNTGPAIRDHHQAAMLEALLSTLHPRWQRFMEVAVHRPSRGFIDAVLHEPRERVAVATELQSELRRLEQLVRWQEAKAASLASWDAWPHLGEPLVSRLLVVRRTRATRAAATDFARQLRVAYPAHPDDALAALSGTASWLGPALVWMTLDGGAARFVSGR